MEVADLPSENDVAGWPAELVRDFIRAHLVANPSFNWLGLAEVLAARASDESSLPAAELLWGLSAELYEELARRQPANAQRLNASRIAAGLRIMEREGLPRELSEKELRVARDEVAATLKVWIATGSATHERHLKNLLGFVETIDAGILGVRDPLRILSTVRQRLR